MRVEWIIIAEGFGTNSNGAVTAIGINQRVVIAPTLPTTTKRGVIAHFSSDSHVEIDREFEVSLNVADPAGDLIVAMTSPAKFSPIQKWPGVPEGIDIFLEIPLRLATPGEYRVSLSLTPPGEERITGHVPLYVIQGPVPPVDSTAIH
jgi:hypothetical protein